MVDAMDTDSCEGANCELVTVPAREGLEAVDILRLREGEGMGPVAHDREGDTLGFVVPPGTAEDWDLPGSACTRARGPVRTAQPPVTGGGWLVTPDGADAQATEPGLLRAALSEATELLAVVDGVSAARRETAQQGPLSPCGGAPSDWACDEEATAARGGP